MIEKVERPAVRLVHGPRIFSRSRSRSAYDPSAVTGDMAKGLRHSVSRRPCRLNRKRGWAWIGRRHLVHAERSADVGSRADRAQADHRGVVSHDDHGAASHRRTLERLRLRRRRERPRPGGRSHGGAVSGYVAQNTVIRDPLGGGHACQHGLRRRGRAQSTARREADSARDVPEIHGPAAVDAARTFLLGLEKGTVDRALGADFDAYLTAARVACRGRRGTRWARSRIRVVNTVERGGMEVAGVTSTSGDERRR